MLPVTTNLLRLVAKRFDSFLYDFVQEYFVYSANFILACVSRTMSTKLTIVHHQETIHPQAGNHYPVAT